MKLPPWVVLHVPHDSTVIPQEVRKQFVLSDLELEREIDRLTDRHTLDLFVGEEYASQVVRALVSRLVVDVERFAVDADEPLAQRGLGAVYTHTAAGDRLRRELLPSERADLMQQYYIPHHARLAERVSASIAAHGRCLVIDCHSFPDDPLPYENGDRGEPRPDICIGTDAFHTSPALRDAFVEQFARLGWSVQVDTPFAGALVPAEHYRRDSRVAAIMVEVNRALYLDRNGVRLAPDFAWVARRVQSACARAIGLAQDEVSLPEPSAGSPLVNPNSTLREVAALASETKQESPNANSEQDLAADQGPAATPRSYLEEMVDVDAQSTSGCGQPRSPMAASQVARGIHECRPELAPCSHASLPGIPRGPSWKPLLDRLRELFRSRGIPVSREVSPTDQNTYVATFVPRRRPTEGRGNE